MKETRYVFQLLFYGFCIIFPNFNAGLHQIPVLSRCIPLLLEYSLRIWDRSFQV